MEHECIPEGQNSTTNPLFCSEYDKLFLKRIKGVPKEMSASQKFKWKTEQENTQRFQVLTNFQQKIPWGSKNKTGMRPLKDSHVTFDFFCSEDFEMIGRRC